MTSRRSGRGTPARARSWTDENLPMAERRELLQRELRELGFADGALARDTGAGAGAQYASSASASAHPAPRVDATGA